MRKTKIYSFLLAAAMLLPSVGVKAQSWTDEETGVEYYFCEGPKSDGEGSQMIIDGNVETKLGTSAIPTYVIIGATQPVSLIGYTLITANDNSTYKGRNPENWLIEGSNDYENWTVIEHVVGDQVLQDVNFTPFDFTCPASEKFEYFRLTIEKVVGGGFMQVSEWHPHGVTHDHSWGDPVETLPTCREEGYYTYFCTECGGYKIVPSGKEATGIHEYENGYCIHCGKAENEPLVDEDGYWILETPQDLIYFANRIETENRFDLCARLENDLDMAGLDFHGVAPTDRYTGEFDGQGHWISNFVYEPGRSNVGLFGLIGGGGYVHHVGLINARLNGDANVAGICGRLYGGVIEECAVVGSYIEGRDHTAAITGDVNWCVMDGDTIPGRVSNCFSDAQIYSREYQAGGISGVINGGTIENCLFSGTVDCGYTNASIAVSLVDSEGVLSVIQNNALLASHNYGFGDSGNGSRRVTHEYGRYAELKNNYSLTTTRLILLIGDSYYYAYSDNIENFANDPNDDNGADITDEEARTEDFYADILGWDIGGIWGFYPDTEGKAYPVLQWMIDSEVKLPTRIFDVPSNAKLIWETGDEYLNLNVIHGSFGQQLDISIVSGDDKATWYPDLGYLYIGDATGAFGGTGDVVLSVGFDEELQGIFANDDPVSLSVYVDQAGDVEIKTVEDLQRLFRSSIGNYKLMNDLDFEGVEFPGIGSSTEPFTGTFDGNGHLLKNITLTVDDKDKVGIFRYTNGATIKNLGISNLVIDAPDRNQVGGLIGECANTTVDQVALTGFINGRDHVGGLLGRTSGISHITNSYTHVHVYAYSQAGGISGTTNQGDTIVFKNDYFAGSVYIYHRGWAGGFIGLVDKSDTKIWLTNCVSIGDVISHTDGNSDGNVAGPWLGGNGPSWNEEYSGAARLDFYENVQNADAVIDAAQNDLYVWPVIGNDVEDTEYTPAAELSAEDMKKQDTYEDIGWDFRRIWKMDPTDYGYPILQVLGGYFATGYEVPEVEKALLEQNSGATYNVQGQRVADDYRGLVIKNGKKFFVK